MIHHFTQLSVAIVRATVCTGLMQSVHIINARREPVWHSVSRRGAGCCLKTPEIQTKWPPFILFIPARFEFLIAYIFLTRP